MARIKPITVDIGVSEYPSDLSEWYNKNLTNCVQRDTEAAIKEIGSERAINILMLGVLSKYLEFKEEDWEKAITFVVKEKFLEKNLEKNLDMNLKAFRLGRSM